MGIFSAAIELFGGGGRTRLTGSLSNNEAKARSTILVINDDLVLLQNVKSLLTKQGYNVLTSASAHKGLEMLHYAAGDVRIVVLDYDMADLNGDEALKFIKQHSPNAKVVGITSMKFDSLPSEHIDGIDILLTKTMVATGLLDAVDELLGDGRAYTSR